MDKYNGKTNPHGGPGIAGGVQDGSETAPTHWLLFALVIDFDGTEAAKIDEEKGDRRQDLTTDGLGKGFPRWCKSMAKSSRDWRAEGKAPVSAGRSPFEGDNCTKCCIRKV